MNDVLPDLNVWTERGDRVALATVVAVQKSAPRAPGAKLLFEEDGSTSGSLFGVS